MLSFIRPLGPLVLATAALATTSFGNTIVVSASGGGAFTDLPPAIAAAQEGDVLLVMPGTYSGFALQKGLTIVGVGSVDVTNAGSTIQIVNIASASRVAIVSVHTAHITMNACAGHVIVQDVTGATSTNQLRDVTVTQCADVRLSNVAVVSNVPNTTQFGALTVSQSRVELVRSTLHGYAQPSPASIGYSGGDGLRATSGCRAHVVLSSIAAGKGADTDSGVGGYGGIAVRLESGSQAILAGDGTQQLLGGDSGYGDFTHEWFSPCSYEGLPGPGAWVDAGAQLSWSGVVLDGGASFEHGTCNPYNGAPISGTATHVVPDDPSLELVGTPAAGSSVTIRLLAPAGASASLELGRNPIVVADGLAPIEDLAPAARSVQLGLVPPSGQRNVTWQIPASLPSGSFLVLQAEVTLPGGVLARTNSVPVVVR